MNKLFLIPVVALLVISCSDRKIQNNNQTEIKETTEKSQSFYDFSMNKPDGTPVKMDTYKGKVVLIVNTATKCGLTPQFEGLQKLHEDFSKQGLVVLGVPCNQFLGQEPNSNEEMEAVCKKDHGVTFQLFEKSDVNGKDAVDLYKFLRVFDAEEQGEKIRWNFEKFLIDRNGNVVKRYKPKTKPEEVEDDILKLLQ